MGPIVEPKIASTNDVKTIIFLIFLLSTPDACCEIKYFIATAGNNDNMAKNCNPNE